MFLRPVQTEATSLTLEETGGITLELNDRFLPYRPVTIGGKQRAEFTWYPGSPEATVQMLGPEEDTISLRGFWKDRFFEPTKSAFTTVPNNPAAMALIGSVSDLVGVVDTMRRMGRQITLKWSGLTRVGHIVAFRQTWHNIHDCEWELDFAVMSQGEQTVPSVGAVTVTIPDAYEVALKAAMDIQDAIFAKSGLPAALAVASQINTALTIAQLGVTAVANVLSSVVTGYVGGVVSVSQNTRRTIATVTGGITQMGTAIASSTDKAAGEFYAWGGYGSQDNAPMGVQLSAEKAKRDIGAAFKRAQVNYTTTRNAVAQQSAATEAQVQTLVAPNNLDLRDVSTTYYKTPNYWRQLMQYNGMSDSTLKAGQQIFLPPVTTFSSSTGNL